MLNHSHFYHATVRNSIIVFGKLFNSVFIKRDNSNGSPNQLVKVPITYGPKEKWLVRSQNDPDLDRPVEIVLPRMTFEITDFSYDPSRKVSSLNQLIIEDDIDGEKRRTQYVPVPYNLGITMYIISKTQEDALQVVEQILPFFTPHYNLTVNLNTQMGYKFDVPTVLNNVTLQDDYDGLFEQRRVVLYTLTFTMKTQMFGPITESEVIRTVQANIKEVKQDELGNDVVARRREFTASVDPITTSVGTSPIPTSEEWNFDF
jgi:hypothetical protein